VFKHQNANHQPDRHSRTARLPGIETLKLVFKILPVDLIGR
jgi:hypothetical protein